MQVVSLTIKLKQLIDFEYIHLPNTVKLIKWSCGAKRGGNKRGMFPCKCRKQQYLAKFWKYFSGFTSVLLTTGCWERKVLSERCSFKVVLQWNKWYASYPVLQPDLDQLQLHEEPVVSNWPLRHHRMSMKITGRHYDTRVYYCCSSSQ